MKSSRGQRTARTPEENATRESGGSNLFGSARESRERVESGGAPHTRYESLLRSRAIGPCFQIATETPGTPESTQRANELSLRQFASPHRIQSKFILCMPLRPPLTSPLRLISNSPDSAMPPMVQLTAQRRSQIYLSSTTFQTTRIGLDFVISETKTYKSGPSRRSRPNRHLYVHEVSTAR